MRARRFPLVSASLAVLAATLVPAPDSLRAQASVALTGRVTSAEEGAMEGVVVSAKKAGSKVTISVVSDDEGRFSFPSAKLDSGQYSLRIRATGYELDGPASVDVVLAVTREVDLKLRKVEDITPQMTNAEWIANFPGSPDQKKFLYGCVGCHTLERIAKSKHDAAGFQAVMKRMAGYANNTHIERPQVRVRARDTMRDFGPDADKQAAYLATLNQSSGAWSYPLKPLARVKGKGTRVVITEYELPRKLMPHDVIVDRDGMVWLSQFDEQFLGKFDPRTLKYAEFAIPVQRSGFPKGTLDLEVDPEGNLWLSHMFQSGIVKFDKKTEKFQAFPLPAGVVNDDSQQSMVGPQRWTVDGKVWLNDAGIPGLHRLDMKTGKFETWKPYEKLPRGPHSVYGIYADSRNNIFFMDFGGENVGRIEAATGKVTLFPTPTPRSRPRRGRMDDQDRVWFAEWRAEKIGMFDTKTEKFREWTVPAPYTAPYDVVLDKNGKVWTAGMNTDRVLRMDLETNEFTEYPLPSQTNIRRVFVDNWTTPPTFWVGNNHHASVVKLEPLD